MILLRMWTTLLLYFQHKILACKFQGYFLYLRAKRALNKASTMIKVRMRVNRDFVEIDFSRSLVLRSGKNHPLIISPIGDSNSLRIV